MTDTPNWSDPNDPAWESPDATVYNAKNPTALGIETMAARGSDYSPGQSNAVTDTSDETAWVFVRRAGPLS